MEIFFFLSNSPSRVRSWNSIHQGEGVMLHRSELRRQRQRVPRAPLLKRHFWVARKPDPGIRPLPRFSSGGGAQTLGLRARGGCTSCRGRGLGGLGSGGGLTCIGQVLVPVLVRVGVGAEYASLAGVANFLGHELVAVEWPEGHRRKNTRWRLESLRASPTLLF